MSTSKKDPYIQFVSTRLRRYSETATVETAPVEVLDRIDDEWFNIVRKRKCQACQKSAKHGDCTDCRVLEEYGVRKPATSTKTLVKDVKRLETMAARAARGETVHHPGDTLATNDSITRVTYSGSCGGAGRTTLKKATSPKMSPRYSN